MNNGKYVYVWNVSEKVIWSHFIFPVSTFVVSFVKGLYSSPFVVMLKMIYPHQLTKADISACVTFAWNNSIRWYLIKMTKLVVFMDHKLCTFASEKIVYYRTTTTTTWNQGKEKRAQFLFCLHLCSAQQGAVKSRDITRASVLKRKYGVVQKLESFHSILRIQISNILKKF